ncbi:MAG: RNA polymerase sigma factor [Bacteroidales bacterium]|jgi:RNA polymerase sigma factor (sigma-70 family)|nr:RNA polymerase sigma factor [Bacteroidales bacterium]
MMTRQEITEFYREHHRRLYNISLRILRDPEEAEEVMQDTLMKYISSPGSFSSAAQISAWLARTCIRASIDRLRRRRRRDAFLEDYADSVIPDEEPDPGAPLPDIGRIRAAMDALPEPYRLVLNLVLIEGLDYGEIAALTGKKEPTLRSLYSRGRVKLVALLNDRKI